MAHDGPSGDDGRPRPRRVRRGAGAARRPAPGAHPAPLPTGRRRPHHGEILAAAADLVDAGQIGPHLDETVYGWADVEHAHRRVGSGSARGKVVIDLTRP
ncbi:zinc-binding dehydrogenase [Pseudofrankia inefficax]|uniref:zinc-binding dehydrogenase n=1 Tax=Pseudofrankia inefficax (strain DSM 45817 / CECT 9037 / DDB 130130 / EuI1c) TaxID=298654 RepID=UPI0002F46B77